MCLRYKLEYPYSICYNRSMPEIWKQNLPVELHQPVKVAAALEGLTIQEWVARAIEERLGITRK